MTIWAEVLDLHANLLWVEVSLQQLYECPPLALLRKCFLQHPEPSAKSSQIPEAIS